MNHLWYYDENGKLRDENGNKVINLDCIAYFTGSAFALCVLGLIWFVFKYFIVW